MPVIGRDIIVLVMGLITTLGTFNLLYCYEDFLVATNFLAQHYVLVTEAEGILHFNIHVNFQNTWVCFDTF